MFKKYNFILGKSNTGKSKLLQDFTSIFENSILFDFESNVTPSDLSKSTQYIHSKNLSGVEELLDVIVSNKIEKDVFIFLDNPDIFYVDKKSDLERLYKKYKDLNIYFFTTLSMNSNFVQDENEYTFDTHKKFNLLEEDCSNFITEKYVKTKEFIFGGNKTTHTIVSLMREYKINQILK